MHPQLTPQLLHQLLAAQAAVVGRFGPHQRVVSFSPLGVHRRMAGCELGVSFGLGVSFSSF